MSFGSESIRFHVLPVYRRMEHEMFSRRGELEEFLLRQLPRGELMKPCGRNAVCESLSEIFALLLTYYFIIKGILRPPNYTLKDKLEKARKADFP